MATERGYGDPRSGGKGRGVFSTPTNQAPVPKFGSQTNMKSVLQGKDAGKVDTMAKKQMGREDLRGKPA
jgi:hypothetical protein